MKKSTFDLAHIVMFLVGFIATLGFFATPVRAQTSVEEIVSSTMTNVCATLSSIEQQYGISVTCPTITMTTAIATPTPPVVLNVLDQLVNPGFETSGATASWAYDWQNYGLGYSRTTTRHGGSWGIVLNKAVSLGDTAGAYQRVDIHQKEIKPVFIGAYLKGNSIVNETDSFIGASMYAEIHLTNGKVVYWNSIRNSGTFAWRWIGFNTGTLKAIDAPIDHIFIVPILAGSKGKAYFDDIQVVQYEPVQSALTIMIDDGEDTTFTQAKPIMDKYSFVGSTAVIVNMVGTEGFMTWDHLAKLRDTGWEIVSHGLAHADLTTLNQAALQIELATSKQQLTNRGFVVNNFAIPFGAYNANILATGAKSYKSMRLYEQGANPQGTFPYDVKVHGVLETTTPEEVLSWIKEANGKKQWVILVFHTISATGDDAYHISPENFEALMKVVKDSGIPVVTYNKGIDMFKTSPTAVNTVFTE